MCRTLLIPWASPRLWARLLTRPPVVGTAVAIWFTFYRCRILLTRLTLCGRLGWKSGGAITKLLLLCLMA